MTKDDAPGGEPLGTRGADIVLREDFKHAVLGELREGCEGTDAQREGGEDEVLEVEVFARAVVVDGIEVAEHVEVGPVGKEVGKEPGDEDGGKEGGERHAQGGEDKGETVNPTVFVERGDHPEEQSYDQREGECDNSKQSRLREGRGNDFGHFAL